MNKNMKKDKNALTTTARARGTAAPSGRPFLTVWEKADKYSYDDVSFRTNGSFTIDWGDGCVEHIKGKRFPEYNLLKHEYEKPGKYTVSIGAGITTFSVLDGSSFNLLEVKQWGDARWKNLQEMFARAENMICTATDTPDLSKVKSMDDMFYSCYKFNSPIEHWDTKRVKYMNNMLSGAWMFNRSLAKMDLKAIEEVDLMLEDTPAFNQDLRGFKPKANTDKLFGYKKSLAQYNEEHGERYDAQDEKQDVYKVLNVDDTHGAPTP